MPIGGALFTLPSPGALDITERMTNRRAQQFVPYTTNTKDVGYVYAENAYVEAFLWNGSDSDIAIDDIIPTENEGIVLQGVEETDIIESGESIRVIVSVSKYGPIAFTATFTFDSGCPLDPVLTITGTRPLILTREPRPIEITEAMEEAYAYSGGGETYYDTLEFVSTGADDKILVVYSDEDLTTPQGTFLACKFDCQLPETEGSVRGQMEITVDFLPREAQQWIMAASRAGGKVTVKWRQYLAPNQEPDAEYPIPLEVVSVEQTPTGVTGTALFPDLVNMPFPRRLMTTRELPGGLL